MIWGVSRVELSLLNRSETPILTGNESSCPNYDTPSPAYPADSPTPTETAPNQHRHHHHRARLGVPQHPVRRVNETAGRGPTTPLVRP
ncbi:hypothetical protein ASPSYDRAFT_464534 [Aspergillus sydowii CBS 593.65]|uniref:Uncharacterized protein n=1 Tax=Aspergillus sydowii CBS 593.65 TaxID=1036612 RepID=A0A1L9T4N8_9EURO|nr:uncharacterized protein ASPSYDRAFT_464534 [Aspergillus sydowii CBS 593.65]OJJ54402.1 hypothetical protein ASPSYDRAFT_464534 [Aspergillus sydowii CBS 593.65]